MLISGGEQSVSQLNRMILIIKIDSSLLEICLMTSSSFSRSTESQGIAFMWSSIFWKSFGITSINSCSSQHHTYPLTWNWRNSNDNRIRQQSVNRWLKGHERVICLNIQRLEAFLFFVHCSDRSSIFFAFVLVLESGKTTVVKTFPVGSVSCSLKNQNRWLARPGDEVSLW